MNEQQEHLANLLQQRDILDRQIAQSRETFWKVQGVIEYLTQIGVTLPQPEPQQETDGTDVEEES